MVAELERKNKELEAFSYSVSHDLRAPLRSIDGFSKVLLEDYSKVLDAKGQEHLSRVRSSAQRMDELIDDMLQLSQVGRADINRSSIDLSAVARTVASELFRKEPDRRIDVVVADTPAADADGRLIRVALDNLLGNAWKFTAKVEHPRIDFRAEDGEGEVVYSVTDNGAGFKMDYADKLFRPFQRLHSEAQFPGTGIGLATVHRIIDRHGGRVWAEGVPNAGAKFYFTLPRATPGGRH
jgi:light-regulated signal transduction histidine kinase (bacteriophytochrome)